MMTTFGDGDGEEGRGTEKGEESRKGEARHHHEQQVSLSKVDTLVVHYLGMAGNVISRYN